MNRYETWLSLNPPKKASEPAAVGSGGHIYRIEYMSDIGWRAYMPPVIPTEPVIPPEPELSRPEARQARQAQQGHSGFREYLGYGQGTQRTRRSI